MRLWLSLGLALSACNSPAPAGPPKNLVLVSMDTLRADHLGAYGYGHDTSPTIDELAEDGVRFADASSTSAWTSPAHASLFTGRYPSQLGVLRYDGNKRARLLREDETTLAEVLQGAGFDTQGFTGGGFVGSAMGFAQGFARYREHQVLADYKDELVAYLKAEHARRFFAFVHFYDCHRPYAPPAPYDRLFRGEYEGAYPVKRVCAGAPPPKDEAERAFVMSQYDGEIRNADELLAEVLEALDDADLEDETLVVFLSDHGDEFFEHGGCDHINTLFQELVHVPLIVRGPGISRGRVVLEPVSLLDVPRTLLELLGVAAPEAMQGKSLASLMRGGSASPEPDRRYVYFETAGRKVDLVGVRDARHKLVARRSGELVGLFDLADDGGEHKSLLGRPEARAKQDELTARLESFRALAKGTAEPGVPLAPDDQERLRALGYVE